jgi:MFS family permease
MTTSTPSPTTARPVSILLVLGAAVLVYTMLETMLTPALPLIQQGVHATTASVAWVLTAVLLSGTVCTPLVGRLADLYDKRPILLVVLLVTCAGILLSAVSTTIVSLAIGQALQGVGLGLVPLALGILRHTQSAAVVKKASGLLVAVSAGSVTVGLILTGVVVAKLPYNWLFWLPLALLAVITVAAWRVVPSCPPVKSGTVDWLGAGLLAAGLLSLLLGVSLAPSWGWLSAGFLLLEAVAVLLLVVFFVTERRVAEPLVDLRLSGRTVIVSCTMTFVIGYATTASFVIIPMIVSSPASTGYGLGAAPSVTGMILIPGGLVGAAAATMVSRLERLVGPRALMVTAGLVVVSSVALLLLASGQIAVLVVSATLGGLGIGLGMTEAMNIVVAAMPPERVASVGGLNYVFRSTGGALGGQIGGSILAAGLTPGTHYSSWSAFSTTFWIGSAVALTAVAASMFLRSRVKAVADLGTSLA